MDTDTIRAGFWNFELYVARAVTNALDFLRLTENFSAKASQGSHVRKLANSSPDPVNGAILLDGP